LFVFAGILPAAAANETWVCTFPGLISKMTVRERLEVTANEVIRDGLTSYHVVENSERGLVATHARSEPAQAAMIIGTLAIDKPTGNFVISVMVPGDLLANKIVTGKCQKEK
jgi:hypothetical protein